MDNQESDKIPHERNTTTGSFTFKKAPHVVILPDGTNPMPLGSGIIVSLLGVGGMSNVYEIWNQQLEMKRAVKLLHPNHTLDSKQRFETEIKITAKLNHPNIVEIHAVGEWNGLPYIEMEKIDGCTLEKLIADRGGLPLEVCTSIGILIGRALHYAHNHEYALYGATYKGIIHRDLKPNNIMVNYAGIVKLMDFGVARPVDASIHTTDNSAVLGTMHYLSPESLAGKTTDIRSDIYSLGAVLYETITGTKAFPDDNISNLMLSKIKNEFKPLDSFLITTPTRLKRCVQKCMSLDREKRYANINDLLVVLERIHKTISHETPETIMAAFMGKECLVRKDVHLKKRLNIPQTTILAFLGIALIAAACSLLMVKQKKQPVTSLPETFLLVQPTIQPREHHDSPLEIDLKRAIPVKTASVNKAKKVSSQTSISSSISAASEKNNDIALQELQEQYGTTNLADIFIKEVKTGHFPQAQKMYGMLKPEEKSLKAVIIYQIRMLDILGEKEAMSTVLNTCSFDDGEIILDKAKINFREGAIAQCLANLETSSRTKCEFLNPATLRQEMMYLKALCLSQQFYTHPDPLTKKNALESWFEVKLLFRSTPEHNYFQKAILEMQKIGDTGKTIKG